MNEEKKYSVIGKVEIGTDEYRDLIETVKDKEREYNEANSERYKEHWRANEAEKQRDIYKAERDSYCEFINSSEEIKAKYKLFLIEKKVNETEVAE